jgi:Protein of unknown function (DUF3175)
MSARSNFSSATDVGRPARKWSQEVTEQSDALDLEHDVFTKGDPKAIARTLERTRDEVRALYYKE